MAGPGLFRLRDAVTVLSRYTDVLPALAAPASASASPAGLLQHLPTGLLHSGAVCHGASSAPYGLAAILPQKADMEGWLVFHTLPLAEDMARSAPPRIFAGLAAGAAAAMSAYVLTQENLKDSSMTNLPVSSPGSSFVGGSGGKGGGDDDERYRLMLKLLLELCQRDDNSDGLHDHYQQLKFMIQKEWYILHKRRESLNAEQILAETDKDIYSEKKKNLDAESERLEKLSCEILMREASLEQRLSKMDADEAKFKSDRILLDEQQEELAEKLYRADLDGKTVKALWSDLQDEKARMAGPGKVKSDTRKEDETAGLGKVKVETGKEDETSALGKEAGAWNAGMGNKGEGDRWKKAGKSASGTWSMFRRVISYPLAMKEWVVDCSFAAAIGYAFVKEIPNMDRSTFRDVIDKFNEYNGTKLAEADDKLLGWGLKKKKKSDELLGL